MHTTKLQAELPQVKPKALTGQIPAHRSRSNSVVNSCCAPGQTLPDTSAQVNPCCEYLQRQGQILFHEVKLLEQAIVLFLLAHVATRVLKSPARSALLRLLHDGETSPAARRDVSAWHQTCAALSGTQPPVLVLDAWNSESRTFLHISHFLLHIPRYVGRRLRPSSHCRHALFSSPTSARASHRPFASVLRNSQCEDLLRQSPGEPIHVLAGCRRRQFNYHCL